MQVSIITIKLSWTGVGGGEGGGEDGAGNTVANWTFHIMLPLGGKEGNLQGGGGVLSMPLYRWVPWS